MSLINGIFLRARIEPQRPAIFLPDRVVTYGMIVSGTLSVEQKLGQLGVMRGQWAAISIDNAARHLIVLLALWRLGIPSASIGRNIIPAATASGCRLLFCEMPEELPADVQQYVVTDDWFTRPASEYIPTTRSAFDADDVCRVSFTSGSTGHAKPIAHSEAAYERRVIDTLLTSFQHPWTRLLIMGGLTTGFGAAQALRSLWLGLTLAFPSTPDDALRMISHFCIETMMGSPMHILDFLDHHEQSRITLPSLRLIQFGGASMGFAGLERLRARFGADLLEEYASTEASIAGIAAGALLDLRRSGPAVFAPVLPVEIVENGEPVPMGEQGDIRIKSPSLGHPFDGNLKCPANDGWFYPGDRGVVRSDGTFAILGRRDNIINAGGVKLNPESLEELLTRHPRVRDVAVLGVKSDNRTRVRAVIVPAEPCSPADITAWMHQNTVSRTRENAAPVVIDDIQFTDTIPRTANRKIARDTLAKLWG